MLIRKNITKASPKIKHSPFFMFFYIQKKVFKSYFYSQWRYFIEFSVGDFYPIWKIEPIWIGNTAEAKSRPSLKILLLLQFLQHILQILHKHSQSKLRRASNSRIFDCHPRSPWNKFKIFWRSIFYEILTWAVIKKFWEANSKIRLLESLRNLVVSVCVKFEECAVKTVGGVGFF